MCACVRACVPACVWVWTQVMTNKSVIVNESVPIVNTVTEINVVTQPEIRSDMKTVRLEYPQYPEYALHKPSLTISLRVRPGFFTLRPVAQPQHRSARKE